MTTQPASAVGDRHNNNLYTAADSDYVPLNNYPTTNEYGATSPRRNQTLEAALAPMTEGRWHILRIGRGQLRKLAFWAGLFLAAAVILAAIAVASPKLYKRKFWTESTDPVSQRLGYTVEVTEKIGVIEVCYKVKTTPLSQNSTGAGSTLKGCKNFAEALLKGSSSLLGKGKKPLPPTSNIDRGHGHHRHHGNKKEQKSEVECYSKTILYSIVSTFIFVGATLAVCIGRKFSTSLRAQKAGIVGHPVPIFLAFVALSLGVLATASGSYRFSNQQVPPEFYEAVQGRVDPSEWPEVDRRSFKLSCSFCLLLWSWATLGLSLVLSLINSSRQYERISVTGSLHDPPLIQE